jgi:hypothetical protein
MTKREHNIQESVYETSLTKQVFIGLVDIVLIVTLATLLFIYQTPPGLYQLAASINGTLFVVLLFVVYRFAMLLVFNGTIGMKLFRSELLNHNLKSLNILEKLLAACFILYKGADYYDY